MKRMNIHLEDEEYENIFERFDQSGKNEIDYVEWNQGFFFLIFFFKFF